MSDVKRVDRKFGVSLLFLILIFSIISLGFVFAGEGGASVWTDKDDYEPGEIVLISGEDFLVNADLSITITRPDGEVESCNIDDCYERFLDGPLSSDEFGGFIEYGYELDGIEGEYLVEVSDGVNFAETSFTDNSVSVIAPNGGEVWSGVNNITWYYALNPFGPWDYDLYYSDDSCEGEIILWEPITSVSCDTDFCNYAWDTTTFEDGDDYCVGIVKTSGLPREDKSDDEFAIDNGFCGDGVKNGDEECDGDDWGDVEQCSDLSDDYNYGDLSCNDVCEFDVSECAYDGQCPAVEVIIPPETRNVTWYAGTVITKAVVSDSESGVAAARAIFHDNDLNWRDPETGLGFDMIYNPNQGVWEHPWDSLSANITSDCSIVFADVFGEDNAGNGASNECVATNRFGIDNTPPVTTKEIGEPSHDDGYYVTTETPITLTAVEVCNDGDGSGVDFIHYEIWWDSDGDGDVDTLLTEEDVEDDEVTFYFDEESLHELRWYAVDNLGNTEEEHIQEHAVDETKPDVTKMVGEPSILVDENCNPEEEICDYYVTQDTLITLECVDPEPHPANDVTLYWRTYLVENEAPEWIAGDDFVEIQFDEDSEHVVEFYCEDALGNSAGTAEDPFVENDIVESQPPIISKELIGHSVEFDCPDGGQDYNFGCYYITQETLVNITAYDPEPHPVDDVEIFCEYWLDGEHYDLGLIEEPFSFSEDSEHQLHCWASDALGNTAHLWELDRVDTQAPVTEKTIDGPKYPEDCIEGGECWITQNSVIELVCEDQEPHPVDDVTLYYRTWLDGNVSQDWTSTDGEVEIQFDEDSEHVVEWYCSDALWNMDGTEEDPYAEVDNVDTAGPEIVKWVSDDLVMPGDLVEICANITDIKQTGDSGVGVNDETVQAILSKDGLGKEIVDLKFIEDNTYCGEWEVPEISEECAEAHCLWDVEVEAEDWLENYNVEDGVQILVDGANPEIQQILNPYPGRYYRDGKSFAVVAEAVDHGGSPEVEGSEELCEATGIAECDFYAFDYPYGDFEDADVVEYWNWLVDQYGEEGVFDELVSLGGVPWNDGVCQGVVSIPEDSGLEDKAFLVHRIVDEAGNWEGDLSRNFDDLLILLDIDNEGPGVVITDLGPLPGPVTEGDVIDLLAEIEEYESGFDECWAEIFSCDEEGGCDEETGVILQGIAEDFDLCRINDDLPFGFESGNYMLQVNARDEEFNIGSDWADMIIDNDRPSMSVVSPLEGEVYGALLPVSLNVEDAYSSIADETVQFRISEIPVVGNLFCIFGTCESTGWVALTEQNNGLYADTIDLDEYDITGEGRYVFDAVACDNLYFPDEDLDLGFDINYDRNSMHCRMISEHGNVGEEERAECDNGLDDDFDGEIDYPADDGCDSAEDDDETGEPPAEEVVVINEFVSIPDICVANGQEGGGFEVGDVVHQLTVEDLPVPGWPNHCSIGLAFDGESLYYNICSDSNMYKIDPITGELLDTFDTGLRPNAMAFDSSRDGIWFGLQSCDGTGMPIYFWDFSDDSLSLEFHVPFGLINPATGDDFLGFCFTDGLAFNANDPDDSSDDEIWFSDDINKNLGVFRPDGTFVTGFDATIVDPSLSLLSGLAVGGQNLYMGNNGGGDIFRADKDTLAFIDQFASEDERLEDMECDPNTFADQNVEVMWVRHTPQSNPDDDLITAFVIESGTCGFGGEPPGDDLICEEFIELYNPGENEISLDDWTIEDNTGSPFDLSGMSILPDDFLVLIKGDDHGFSLNNPGDIIILKNSDGEVDKVVYGNYNDTNIEDNAPAPGEGESAGRFPNGIDTNVDIDDFSIFEFPTPGFENLFV